MTNALDRGTEEGQMTRPALRGGLAHDEIDPRTLAVLGTRCGRCGCRKRASECQCSCHSFWCDCHGLRPEACEAHR